MKCILLPARLQYFGSIGVLILKVIHTRPAKAGTESCRCAGVFHLYMHESGLSYTNIINEQNLNTNYYTIYTTILYYFIQNFATSSVFKCPCRVGNTWPWPV